MKSVESVRGPIDGDSLGLMLVHEHLLVRSDAVQWQFPRVYQEPEYVDRAVEALSALRARGVTTVCDPTVMGLGRDIAFMQQVSDAADVNVIAATGIYTLSRLPPIFADRSVGYLADIFVADIEEGIQGSTVRAAFLKCATDERGITPDIEKALRATARAHARTGAPIMTHSLPANESGLAQQDIFEDEGVDLTNVIIGHCGDSTDIAYLTRLLERGSILGMDRYGMDDLLDTNSRNETVVALCQRGFERQLVLSQDSVCLTERVYSNALKESRRNWHFLYVVDEVIPQLEALGLTRDVVEAMISTNVQRWLLG